MEKISKKQFDELNKPSIYTSRGYHHFHTRRDHGRLTESEMIANVTYGNEDDIDHMLIHYDEIARNKPDEWFGTESLIPESVALILAKRKGNRTRPTLFHEKLRMYHMTEKVLETVMKQPKNNRERALEWIGYKATGGGLCSYSSLSMMSFVTHICPSRTDLREKIGNVIDKKSSYFGAMCYDAILTEEEVERILKKFVLYGDPDDYMSENDFQLLRHSPYNKQTFMKVWGQKFIGSEKYNAEIIHYLTRHGFKN